MKKLLSVLVVVVLLVSLFAPMAAAEGAPGREDLRGHGDIAIPNNDSWLSSYETRYVCASGGVAAFLFSAPVVDMDKLIDTVLEGTELTLLAEQNGFCLVKMADGRVGWLGKGQTAENTDLLDSVPDLTEGSWIYERGEGERNTFAVKFLEGRCAKAARAYDGGRISWSWILSGRRVMLDGKYFIWDGEKFVSRDEFQTVQGKVRFVIRPDTEGLYDKLS